MTEIKEHEAYKLLDTKYSRVCLDYVILSVNGEYCGTDTHKKAVIKAFEVLAERFSEYDLNISLNPDKMAATASSMCELLRLPDEPRRTASGGERSFTPPSPLTYFHAFSEPPHGTPYSTEDFTGFNSVLFPNIETTEVYRWNDDFSDYFDAGKEWWGTGLWSAIDTKTGTAVVIGASLSD